MKRLYCLFYLMSCMALPLSVRAEKADADKPTNVEANQMAYDDVKQVNTFIGNVVLTRGTLIMKAEKMVVTQSPEGYQFATMYAAPSRPATFRQKRDGGDNLWIEGQAADRIEYDGKTEVARLFSKAKITLLDGTKPTDEVEGEFISYDSRAEFYSVNNTPTGDSKPGAGRIRATIQPRKETKGN
jgi:lipopolysaccharide export system protein LptA